LSFVLALPMKNVDFSQMWFRAIAIIFPALTAFLAAHGAPIKMTVRKSARPRLRHQNFRVGKRQIAFDTEVRPERFRAPTEFSRKIIKLRLFFSVAVINRLPFFGPKSCNARRDNRICGMSRLRRALTFDFQPAFRTKSFFRMGVTARNEISGFAVSSCRTIFMEANVQTVLRLDEIMQTSR
jgi:hypothetical protein